MNNSLSDHEEGVIKADSFVPELIEDPNLPPLAVKVVYLHSF